MLSLEKRRREKSYKKQKERRLTKFVASFVGTTS